MHPASSITYFFYFPKCHLSFHTFLPLHTVKSLPQLNVCFHNIISKFLSFLKASLHFPPPQAIRSYSFVLNSFIEVLFAYHKFIHLKYTMSFSKSIHLCNHPHNPVLELNITPKSSLHAWLWSGLAFTPISGTHWSAFCLYSLVFSRNRILNHTVCSLSRLASFSMLLLSSSMLFHVSIVCSFLLPSNIPLCGYTIFCLPTYQLMNIWVIFDLGLFRKYRCGHLYTSLGVYVCFLLGSYLGLEFLGHMLSICLTFEETSKVFQSGGCNLCFVFWPAMYKGFGFSTSLLILGIICRLFIAMLMNVYVVVSPCSLFKLLSIVIGYFVLYWMYLLICELF